MAYFNREAQDPVDLHLYLVTALLNHHYFFLPLDVFLTVSLTVVLGLLVACFLGTNCPVFALRVTLTVLLLLAMVIHFKDGE